MSTTTDVLDPQLTLTDAEVHRRFLEQMLADETATVPAISSGRFARMVAELSARPRLFSFVDLFCGAGGSSIGLTMAGGKLLFAANHAPVAVATHEANFPGADHECADLNHYDMRSIPRGADVLWASPLCTEISPAGGKKRGKKGNPDQFELIQVDGHVSRETYERTRATFHDVFRAAEVHRFKYIIVENVPEAAKDWEAFGWWLDGMTTSVLGYHAQIVCVSSAHVGGPLNPHAPQRRNRMYIVFNRADMPRPNVTPRPLSMCDTCGPVQGVQAYKDPRGTLTACGRRYLIGAYGIKNGQYVYRCPNFTCQNSIVTPFERPAATVIDWSDQGTRICDRTGKDALVPNTIGRIERGLRLYGGEPVTSRSEWAGLSIPPGAFIETKRNNVVPTSAWEPFTTVTAGGNHHGLVIPYYRTGKASPTSDPLPTLTTKARFGLVQGHDGAVMDVRECLYRMVNWKEQSRAQRFPVSYLIMGNEGERGVQAGNAVSSNVAQWLGECVAEALHRGSVLA